MITADWGLLHSTDCQIVALSYFLAERGLRDPAHIDEINSRLGRKYGEQDLHGYAEQLMLAAGCDRIMIFEGPLLTEPEPYEEWLAARRRYDPAARDTRVYRESYELAVTGMKAIGELYRKNSEHWHHESRRPTTEDISRLLADDRVVLDADFGGGPGWAWGGVVFGPVTQGTCRAFETRRGEFAVNAAEALAAADGELYGLTGWRVPADRGTR